MDRRVVIRCVGVGMGCEGQEGTVEVRTGRMVGRDTQALYAFTFSSTSLLFSCFCDLQR